MLALDGCEWYASFLVIVPLGKEHPVPSEWEAECAPELTTPENREVSCFYLHTYIHFIDP